MTMTVLLFLMPQAVLISWICTNSFIQVSLHPGAFSSVPRMPVMSSPIYGIFSPRSGEYPYALFTSVLIGRLLSAAGNRLTASLRLQSASAGTQCQLKSRE